MRAGLSFSYSPISLLLRQPLSIKKSYAGAIHLASLPLVSWDLGTLLAVSPEGNPEVSRAEQQSWRS
jgi:hypothetical protein